MATVPRIRWLSPFTKRFINPVTRRFAGSAPGFALLVYPGRRTGRTYRTPINVFVHGGEYVFALTYGSDVDWVKNVLAANGCALRIRGRDVTLVDPVVFVDESRRRVPLPVRVMLILIGTTEFLRMREAPTPTRALLA
jgi:deazaflavin-dependent oxidoreductase (nitroreductase family)